jgi:hypothetical protein
MDTGGIAKIPAATAPMPPRAEAVHPGAARTELPREATVRPADGAEAVDAAARDGAHRRQDAAEAAEAALGD